MFVLTKMSGGINGGFCPTINVTSRDIGRTTSNSNAHRHFRVFHPTNFSFSRREVGEDLSPGDDNTNLSTMSFAAGPLGPQAFRLQNLNFDFTDAATHYVAITAAAIIFYLFYKFSSPPMDSREPPVLKPKIPMVGHIVGLAQHGIDYLEVLRYVTFLVRSFFCCRPFRIRNIPCATPPSIFTYVGIH